MVVLALGDSIWLTSLRIRADTIRGSAVSPGAIEAVAGMAAHAGMEHLRGDGSPVPYPGPGPRRESFAFTAVARP